MTDSNQTKYLRDLRYKIAEFFNSDELSHLVFDLGVKWDELSGSVLSSKVQSLISLLAREGRLEELVDLLQKKRPKVEWPSIPPPDQQKEDELATISDSEREAILQEYLAKMNEFAMKSNILRKKSFNNASANALTKTYFPRLDKKRIEIAIRFLAEAKFNLEIFDFSEIDLSEANFGSLNLSKINLRKANLESVNLMKSNLSFANLREANLTKADLQAANFDKANLTDSNLANANLQMAKIGEANLNNTDLRNSNLREAKLYKVNLTRVIVGGYFGGAAYLILSDAAKIYKRRKSPDSDSQLLNIPTKYILIGSDLSQSNLEGADLSGAKYCANTKWPEGVDPEKAGAFCVDQLTTSELLSRDDSEV